MPPARRRAPTDTQLDAYLAGLHMKKLRADLAAGDCQTGFTNLEGMLRNTAAMTKHTGPRPSPRDANRLARVGRMTCQLQGKFIAKCLLRGRKG